MNACSTAKKCLLISVGIILSCFSGNAQTVSRADADTLVQVVWFDLKKQPLEASGREYEIGFNPNPISSASLPSFPDGAKITEIRFCFPNLETIGDSYGSDVLFGFSGAVNAEYNYGDHAPERAAKFDFKCVYDHTAVHLSGGKINLHYFDVVNDNFLTETIFETGRNVATLRISYTMPKVEIAFGETIPFHSSEDEVSMQPKPGITIFPNPTPGQLLITIPANEKAIAIVYDLHGKMILENEIQNGEILDITDANPGIYTIRIATQNSIFTRKIVKL